MTPLEPNSPLLKDREVAGLLNVSLGKIRRWRLHGGGPPFLKIDSSVRYVRQDVLDWLEQQYRNPST